MTVVLSPLTQTDDVDTLDIYKLKVLLDQMIRIFKCDNEDFKFVRSSNKNAIRIDNERHQLHGFLFEYTVFQVARPQEDTERI